MINAAILLSALLLPAVGTQSKPTGKSVTEATPGMAVTFDVVDFHKV